jgi:hypothetical protein
MRPPPAGRRGLAAAPTYAAPVRLPPLAHYERRWNISRAPRGAWRAPGRAQNALLRCMAPPITPPACAQPCAPATPQSGQRDSRRLQLFSPRLPASAGRRAARGRRGRRAAAAAAGSGRGAADGGGYPRRAPHPRTYTRGAATKPRVYHLTPRRSFSDPHNDGGSSVEGDARVLGAARLACSPVHVQDQRDRLFKHFRSHGARVRRGVGPVRGAALGGWGGFVALGAGRATNAGKRALQGV